MFFSRERAWGVAVAVLVSSAAVVMAQGRVDLAEAGPLTALVAEIRQLRLAVEEATRSQTQTQALGIYLSVQQARLVQVAARVDTTRKELDAATLRSQEVAGRLAAMTDDLERVADPEVRRTVEEASRALRREQAGIAMQIQQAQIRETELSQMLHVEDARWTDLISRLEQLIGR